ncbi:glycosyltransferase family 2 protein [Jatrophihabitans sp.]|uniref:glycosyltransferase family 2 protein n=1 Tax=Jatrophihabitans sp. TaxID=1932789 RepID=UPI0030C72E5A|nr:glycosyltransferase [Jatrophihabitans sp.]
MRIDLVLPCLNEATALPWVLSRVPDQARAIVVDNGSTDGSADVARSFGATVVECTQRGYGAACRAGLAAATAELVAFCDCDATLHPADLLRLVTVLDGGADMVVARRRPTEPSAWPLHARLANRELARRIRRHTGVPLRDLGPLRVARRDAYRALKITDTRCGYPVETIVRASRAGWRIEQVDVAYWPRLGTSKVTGTLRGSLLAVRDMSAALTS